jgi:hypothetical protein
MKEEQIRPQDIYNEYLSLAEKDAHTFFSEAELTCGSCPACESDGVFAFSKNGFSYETCPNCLSLFVNPRPSAKSFLKYYTESDSAEFWATTFYKETAEARREKLWRPKAKIILEKLNLYLDKNYEMVDIGGGLGIFAEEIKKLTNKAPVIIEPGPKLAEACQNKSLVVIQKFLEEVEVRELPEGPKVFVSFELFEHLHDPAMFLVHLNRLMGSGDLFIFTTLSGLGLDIQVLWENAKAVTPPHHLNFLNPYAIAILLGRLGFDCIEVTTPGQLDIDILSNNLEKVTDHYWQTFVKTASEDEKVEWQKMIAKSGRSSHMMVVCSKP